MLVSRDFIMHKNDEISLKIASNIDNVYTKWKFDLEYEFMKLQTFQLVANSTKHADF